MFAIRRSLYLQREAGQLSPDTLDEALEHRKLSKLASPFAAEDILKHSRSLRRPEGATTFLRFLYLSTSGSLVF